ncbi:hypothetical protein F5877DRAFT_64928 [Lentinula edodes]|nr:hypothetical protein F5877DRAFT_64928 [Lentinula edodes]
MSRLKHRAPSFVEFQASTFLKTLVNVHVAIRTQVSCKSLSLMLSTVANDAIPTKVMTSKTLHRSVPLIENVPLIAAHAIQCLYNSGVEDSQVKSQTWALSIYQHAASSNAQLLQSDNFEGTKGSLDSVAGHGEHPQSRDAAATMVHSGAYYNMFLNSIEKAPFTTFEIESNAVMDGSEDVGTLEIKEHATSMSANDVSPSVPSTSTSAAATLTPSDPVTPTTSGITDDSAMSPVITPTLVPAKKASGFMKPGKSTSVRNLSAIDWVKTNKGGSTAEFAAHWNKIEKTLEAEASAAAKEAKKQAAQS